MVSILQNEDTKLQIILINPIDKSPSEDYRNSFLLSFPHQNVTKLGTNSLRQRQKKEKKKKEKPNFKNKKKET